MPEYSGFLAVLPWLRLSAPVTIGGQSFVPAGREDRTCMGPDFDALMQASMVDFVDHQGKPITRWTVVPAMRRRPLWETVEDCPKRVLPAARLLALACMAEQRFFGAAEDPYANSSIFRPHYRGISTRDDHVAVHIPRRTGGTLESGFRRGEWLFQMPLSAYGASPPTPCRVFTRALDRARLNRAACWRAIDASLPIFLTAHADDPALGDRDCAMLSAAAFELLLHPRGERKAVALARSFEALLSTVDPDGLCGPKSLRDGSRAKPDERFKGEQLGWRISTKWMKELYDLRNNAVHGPKESNDLAKSWTEAEHVVAAAFMYPLAVKLMLTKDGYYNLSEDDRGACDAIDCMLDSEDWGFGCRSGKQWSRILGEARGTRGLRRHLEEAIATLQTG